MKNLQLTSAKFSLLLLFSLPVMGGTILEYRGTYGSGTNGDYFAVGNNTAFNTASGAPVTSTAQGNYKDIIWKGGDNPTASIEQSNANYNAESLSITNGKYYTAWTSSTSTAPALKLGTTGTAGNSTETYVPFWNANVPGYTGTGTTSPGYLDLLYLSNNSTLKINATNQVGINSGTGGLYSVSIRQSGNFNIESGSTFISDAAITGNSTRTLTFTGGGYAKLNGNNTYGGTTTVSSGTLELGSAGVLGSNSVVQSGSKFIYNSSATYAKTLTLNGNGTSTRATFSGNATVGTSVALDNLGDTLSPGNSPGTMAFTANQTWTGFSYDWELNSFASGATAGTNFDKIAITGNLTLNSAGSYQLNLLSLTASNVSGSVDSFTEANRSWTILSTTTGISNFDASKWTLNKNGFSASSTPAGSFSLAVSGNDLVLSYAMGATSAFSTWLSNNSLSGANASPTADPDGDGVSNALEFVLGGVTGPTATNSIGLLPTVSQNSGGDMTFTFARATAAKDSASLTFQWSTDLTFPTANNVPIGSADSSTGGVSVAITSNSPSSSFDTIVITVPIAKALGGKIFGRLSATVTP